MCPGSQFFRRSPCLGRGWRFFPMLRASAVLPSAVQRLAVVAVPPPHQAWSRAMVTRLTAHRVIDHWICQTCLPPSQHASHLTHEHPTDEHPIHERTLMDKSGFLPMLTNCGNIGIFSACLEA